MRTLYPALTLILNFCILHAQERRPLAPQIQRGQDLFLKQTKGLPCGTCHSLAGVGTAVGPDLKTLGSAVGPHGIVMAMHMTITAYVQEVKLASGISYPGLVKGKLGEEMEIWDLSKMPPELRKLSTKEAVLKQNTSWKHPPVTVEYTDQELADIVAFIKWASTGSAKLVKPEDVAEAK